MERTAEGRMGLALAGSTVCLWATLPVAAKLAQDAVDSYTLTWFRLVLAAVVTASWHLWRNGRPTRKRLGGSVWVMLTAAALGLFGNYVLYMVGLEHSNPGTAQVVSQLGPLLLGIGGVIFFGERFGQAQWGGFTLLLLGMGLFFQEQLQALWQQVEAFLYGSLLVALAAVAWASYALIQKKLAEKVSSTGVLMYTYVVGALMLTPMSTPEDVLQVEPLALGAMVFIGLNTVLSYGAFVRAMQIWDGARVSAVLTLTPLATLFVVEGLSAMGSTLVTPQPVSTLGWVGAMMVVLGSMVGSMSPDKALVRVPRMGPVRRRRMWARS